MGPQGLSSLWASHKERPTLNSSMETAPQIPPSQMDLSHCLLKQLQLYQPCINTEKQTKKPDMYMYVWVFCIPVQNTHTHTHTSIPQKTHIQNKAFVCNWKNGNAGDSELMLKTHHSIKTPKSSDRKLHSSRTSTPCILDLRKKGM